MSSTTLAEVFTVGELLADELEARGWTQAEFAEVLGRPAQFVSEIISGKKEITRESAAQIGAAFGTSPDIWLNIQDRYHLWLQAKDSATQIGLGAVRLRARLRELAPVSVLVKRGFLTDSDPQTQAQELAALYDMPDLKQDPDFVVAARRSNPSEALTPTQIAWIACVRKRAEETSVAEHYSSPRLRDVVKDLARVTSDVERFRTLPTLFGAAGVKLVFVEAFPASKFDGCSLLVDGHPVIGLSGRGQRLDKILFTLLHEAAHVLLGHLETAPVILDEGDSGDTVGIDEQAANDQAGRWLLPEPLPSVPTKVSPAWVRTVAARQGVHPIVVVGQLQRAGALSWRTALVKGAPNVQGHLAAW